MPFDDDRYYNSLLYEDFSSIVIGIQYNDPFFAEWPVEPKVISEKI